MRARIRKDNENGEDKCRTMMMTRITKTGIRIRVTYHGKGEL